MELNEQKLKRMLSEHQSRGGELERLLTKAMGDDPPKTKEEHKALLQITLRYYRHVGAIWVLEGILNGKDYEWDKAEDT